jgi:Retron-type reverse transcriptase
MSRQDGGVSVVAYVGQTLNTGEGRQQSIRLQVAEVVERKQGECPMEVDKMQKKLAVCAQDPGFRFDDIYNLIYDRDWLHRAFGAVKSNSGSKTAGVDGQTVSDFEASLEENIEALARSLKREEFAPKPVRRTYIPKGDGRKRPLGIPTVRDRIVQEALRMVLEPIYETDFDQYSFGFRPGRRTHDAIKAAYLAMNNRKKMFWVIDADIEGFFDNLDHLTLEQILQDRIGDQSVRD